MQDMQGCGGRIVDNCRIVERFGRKNALGFQDSVTIPFAPSPKSFCLNQIIVGRTGGSKASSVCPLHVSGDCQSHCCEGRQHGLPKDCRQNLRHGP